MNKDLANKGVAGPLRVLSADEAAELLSKYLAWKSQAPPTLSLNLDALPAWMDSAIMARCDAVMSAAYGRPAIVKSIGIFDKMPDEKTYVSWHQDVDQKKKKPAAYNENLVTLWLALTPSDDLNGCVRFVTGSHKRGVVNHAFVKQADNMLTRGQVVPVDEARDPIVDIHLAPGQASLHHALTIHGSKPNRSAQSRVGLAFRYLPKFRPWEPGYWTVR